MPKFNLSRKTSDRCKAVVRQNESFEEHESRLSQVRINIANHQASEISPVREMWFFQQRIQTSS